MLEDLKREFWETLLGDDMSNNDRFFHQRMALRRLLRAMYWAGIEDPQEGYRFLLWLGWPRHLLKRYVIHNSRFPYVARQRCTDIDRAVIDLHRYPANMRTA